LKTSPFALYTPAGVPNGLLDSWSELWSGAGLEVMQELRSMFTSSPRVLDLPRWYDLVTARERPTWSTANEVTFEDPLARLRDFSTDPSSDVVPVLVLPPQAGHDSCIVDYSPQQSQMRTILDAGLPRALSLDWLGATAVTADACIEDYLDVIDRAVDHAGGRVNLIGDCQGGWLATIYAALSPERINTLTIAGAPIDFHAGEPVIHEVLRQLAPGGELAFYKALVQQGGGVLKGEHMVTGFVMIRPIDELKRQLALLRKLDDSAHVQRYSEFENWFKHTQDIPGRFFLWIIEHLFRDNELVSHSLRVRDRIVDLHDLDMPLNLMAGATDHITPPDQVFALAHEVSTPAEQIRHEITGGGHLGLFMGHEALRDHWPVVLAAVREHSGT
jgi:poly(3-hydroxyalkanoate) synthetase